MGAAVNALEPLRPVVLSTTLSIAPQAKDREQPHHHGAGPAHWNTEHAAGDGSSQGCFETETDDDEDKCHVPVVPFSSVGALRHLGG